MSFQDGGNVYTCVLPGLIRISNHSKLQPDLECGGLTPL